MDPRDPDLLINVVAVGTGPVVWQVWCEICDDEVSETTTDGDLADVWEKVHGVLHGYPEDKLEE